MTYWLAHVGKDRPEGPYTKAELSRKYEAGEAHLQDQVCLQGTECWQDLGKLLDSRDSRHAHAIQEAAAPLEYAKKKRTTGHGGIGCLMILAGLTLLAIIPVLGVILIVGALVLDQASVHYVCRRCGNITGKHARECAGCRAIFR